MTNMEMKTILEKNGLSAADVEKISGKYDAEKITELVESSACPREAFEKIHQFYPEVEVAELEKQMDFVQSQLEAAWNTENKEEVQELSENELDMVAGGGFFSWISDNWQKVAVGVTTGILCAATCGVGGMLLGAGLACAFVGTSAAITAGGIIGGCVGAGVGFFGGGYVGYDAESK